MPSLLQDSHSSDSKPKSSGSNGKTLIGKKSKSSDIEGDGQGSKKDKVCIYYNYTIYMTVIISIKSHRYKWPCYIFIIILYD